MWNQTQFWAEDLVESMWKILDATNRSQDEYFTLGKILTFLHDRCLSNYTWFCDTIP